MATAKKKTRVACFVDGFNLYHAIDNLRDEQNNSFPFLKWLDLKSLARAFVPPSTHEVVAVYYYSAYATWHADAYKKHRDYTAALQHHGTTVVMGRFKVKTKRCKQCGSEWKAHSEKESDVNLALGILEQAHAKSFDHALVVTADSDQCPTIKLVRRLYPALIIEVLTPPQGYDLANELRGIVNTRKIKLKHLHKNLLPATITLKDGSTIIRPSDYDPPAGHF